MRKVPSISGYALPWEGFELTTLVVIGTDYIGSCKSNYHTIIIIMQHMILIRLFER
jgi:hypothetical protein